MPLYCNLMFSKSAPECAASCNASYNMQTFCVKVSNYKAKYKQMQFSPDHRLGILVTERQEIFLKQQGKKAFLINPKIVFHANTPRVLMLFFSLL